MTVAQLFKHIFVLWLPLFYSFAEDASFTLYSSTNYALFGLWKFLLDLLLLRIISSVDTNNTNIVARSEPFIFIFYLYWNFIYVQWTGSSHFLDTLVFTVWFTQLIHVCCSPFQYGCLDLPLSFICSFICTSFMACLVQSSVSKNCPGYS